MQQQQAINRERMAMQVSRRTIIANIVLSVLKLAAGIIGHSAAMLSDAVHSLSDVLSTAIVMVGIKLANKGADRGHPYGHERFECVAAILLSGLLLATGLGIGYGGVRSILSGQYAASAGPTGLALAAAILSIIVKEAMYWYTRAAAKKLDSGVLMANAWHHRSDALSSVGSFIGILGAQLGYPATDSLACLVICVFIVKAAADIFRDAVGKMTDKAADEAVSQEIHALILLQEGVLGVDKLKTRQFGDKLYVDVDIRADGSATLREAHGIAERVHRAIEDTMQNVKHCMVHVNPG